MAPEQVRGHAVEAPADVYALGLVLLEAISGQREYPGTAVESAIAAAPVSGRAERSARAADQGASGDDADGTGTSSGRSRSRGDADG
jgi:hypothetical protein